jgi:TM2 domain-containing membrane protein YozV
MKNTPTLTPEKAEPTSSDDGRFDPVEVDLKNRPLAAFLAWLWPGAGHVYQGRYGKGMLFMICILVTYFWGLALGDGHVVYASFRKADMHYPFILQAGVGLPAMPAVIQSATGVSLFGESRIMYPPHDPQEQTHDEKAVWHRNSGQWFAMGTLFTMVAGIMNLLVIFDAYSGPAFGTPESQSTYGSGPPAEDNTESTLKTVGAILGIILALTIRSNMESDSRTMTYALAICGGIAGSAVGRITNHVYRLIVPLPVTDDPEEPASGKES